MRSSVKQNGKKTAFSIMELLTVMSIIVILIGLVLPALSKVRRYAKTVKQHAQFHSISTAMELFNSQNEGYPDSSATDPGGNAYCGAMKLAEAMLGQDKLGFNPNSSFWRNGTIDGAALGPNNQLYPINPTTNNLSNRQGPYLELENANANRICDFYYSPNPVGLDPIFRYQSNQDTLASEMVLCDVFPNARNRVTGKQIGMPILYYKANKTGIRHDPNNFGNPAYSSNDIYHWQDNDQLIQLGVPQQATGMHPMSSTATPIPPNGPRLFYQATINNNITTVTRPWMSDSYLLLSAGFDGLYGTSDDIYNFKE